VSGSAFVAVLAAVSLSACTASARAAEGDLDPSFGSGGRVQTTVGSSARQDAMTVDAQGRILAVGEAKVNANDGDILVVRYLADGTPDPSFDGDGMATFDFPAANDFDEAEAVTLDAQGRILLFGETPGAGGTDFALIRVNPDGTRDTTFGPSGSNGYVTKSVSGADEYASAIALDAQGRILVAGSARIGGDLDFAVVRFDANGNMDMTFSGDGQQTVDFTPVGNDQDNLLGMVIDSQGRIVLAGRTQQPSLYDFALARLNSDGSRDATFGPSTPSEEGEVTTSFTNGPDGANALTIDSQGRIIAAGGAGGGGGSGTPAQFALARYNSDGSLDTTFSYDGKQTTEIEGIGDGEEAYYVGVDSQGRVVAAGGADTSVGPDDYALARYESNGELDPTFGSGGKMTLANGLVRSAVMDAQDRIVVGGAFDPGGGVDSQFGLVRFIGDAIAPTVTIGSGPADGSFINDRKPTFEFSSEAGATFTCGLDGIASTCTSPFTPSAPLPDGQHTFSLTATDRAANSSAATRTFTVDTRPPEITIKGKRKVKTDKPKAKDKLKIKTSEEAELTCAVDKKDPKPCDAKFKTPKLKLGKHKVTVTATDQAGNSSDEAKKIKVVPKP
jgi:uncharacterized delta-60 repeat protein